MGRTVCGCERLRRTHSFVIVLENTREKAKAAPSPPHRRPRPHLCCTALCSGPAGGAAALPAPARRHGAAAAAYAGERRGLINGKPFPLRKLNCADMKSNEGRGAVRGNCGPPAGPVHSPWLGIVRAAGIGAQYSWVFVFVIVPVLRASASLPAHPHCHPLGPRRPVCALAPPRSPRCRDRTSRRSARCPTAYPPPASSACPRAAAAARRPSCTRRSRCRRGRTRSCSPGRPPAPAAPSAASALTIYSDPLHR